MPVSKMPDFTVYWLHKMGLRKMTPTELILFSGRHIRHYFDPGPGSLIYHYTNVRGAEGILSSKHIWLSEFEKTNDASEFTFAKSRFSEAIELFRSEYTEELVASYFKQLSSFERGQSLVIGSFTENSDDIAQWDRYANLATGCVLGFDANWFYRYPGVRLHRIVYDRDYLNHLVEANLYILRRVTKELKLDLNREGFVFPSLFVFEHLTCH